MRPQQGSKSLNCASASATTIQENQNPHQYRNHLTVNASSAVGKKRSFFNRTQCAIQTDKPNRRHASKYSVLNYIHIHER